MISEDLLASYQWDDDYVVTSADKTNIIVVKITSLISILSSICILVETFADMRSADQAASTVTRILFFLQFGIIMSMTMYFLGSWPAPSHTTADAAAWNKDGGYGTYQTCEAQGFFLIFGSAVTIGWDIALSVTYVLMIRYNVSNDNMRKLEWCFHGIIWTIGLIIALPPIFLNLYNPDWETCGLDTSPQSCVEATDDEDACYRGDPDIAALWQMIIILYVLVGVIVSVVAMINIWCYARNLERRNSRYSSGHVTSGSTSPANNKNNSSRRTRSRGRNSSTTTLTTSLSSRIAWQGIWYSGAILLSYLPLIIHMTIYTTCLDCWNEWFAVFELSMRTLYGYFYLLVFLRQRSSQQMKTRYGKFIRRLFTCWDWDCSNNTFKCPRLLQHGSTSSSDGSIDDQNKYKSNNAKDELTLPAQEEQKQPPPQIPENVVGSGEDTVGSSSTGRQRDTPTTSKQDDDDPPVDDNGANATNQDSV